MAKSVLHRIRCILAVLGCLLFSACSTTKFVPEGKYLLNKAHIKVKDTKAVTSSDLNDYLRQKQNTELSPVLRGGQYLHYTCEWCTVHWLLRCR